MRDRRGYTRSPITLPEFRRGRPAPNKDRKLPTEILPPDEVTAFLRSYGRSTTDRRDYATAVLAYRCALKTIQLLALERPDYDPRTGTLAVPGTHGRGKTKQVLD